MAYQFSDQLSELVFKNFTISTCFVRSATSYKNFEARRIKTHDKPCAKVKAHQAIMNEASILQELVGIGASVSKINDLLFLGYILMSSSRIYK